MIKMQKHLMAGKKGLGGLNVMVLPVIFYIITGCRVKYYFVTVPG
jgi:hypothetical protein